MKVNSIGFGNYKAFFEKQELKIKPITVIIGKNSSGKSAIAKLFTILENSLSGKIDEPLLLTNNDVCSGSQFRDLVYNQQNFVPIDFTITFDDDKTLDVSVLQQGSSITLTIYKWHYKSKHQNFTFDYIRDSSGQYLGNDGEKYICEFCGFIPVSIRDIRDTRTQLISKFLLGDLTMEVDYIGPFRILPKRQFLLTGQIDFKYTGSQGENAYSMLGISHNFKDNKLYSDVGTWYKNHFDGWELIVKNNNQYHEIALKKGEIETNIVDVGQGMNQALPLVVRANWGRKNSIVVIEQPELHLHPAAHGELAELFVESAKDCNQNFVVETHSENFLLRLRRLIVEKKYGFHSDDVVIYWVSESETQGQHLVEIKINEKGELSDWPEGVFTENIVEILAMRNAAKNQTSDKK